MATTEDIAEVDALLARSMDLSSREVTAATEALVDMYSQGHSQVDVLTALGADFEAGESGSLASQLHRQSQSARTLVDGMQQISASQQSRAEEIGQVVDTLRQVVKSMSKLNFASHLLALNVAVEAARLGSRAGAMSVVADEMQRHSAKTEEATEHILGLADELNKLLQGITQQSDRLHQLGESEGRLALTTASEVEEALDSTQRGVQASVASARAQAQALTQSAHQALEHLQFQDRMEQLLDRARGLLFGLPSLADETRRHLPFDARTSLEEPAEADDSGEIEFL